MLDRTPPVTKRWFFSVSVLAMAAACRGRAATEALPPSLADGGSDVEAAAAVPAPPAAEAAPRVEALLPSADALRAPFRDTSADGFIAVSAGGARLVTPIRAAATVDLDRPVLVASFTKLWVAVATLRLVARGELSLDDTIAKALPALAARPWSDSTVRELLTHTSRVPELEGFWSRKDVDFTNAPETLARSVPRVVEKRGVYKYRNAELAIVGAILEARAGARAGAVLAREVFEPAKMTHAGLLVGNEVPSELDLRPVGALRPQNFFTAGAGYASARDLLAFFEALGDGTLLDEASRRTLFDGAPERGYGALGCWAYPFALGDAGTTPIVERPGSFGNVRLYAAFFPESRHTVIAWSREPVDMAHPRVARGIGTRLARIVIDVK